MRATIRDVAARADVSTATVSRAMRSEAGVDPATRDRVLAAARALHYRPSGVARSLKLRATRTLGLIITDIENPYFPQVVRAVEDAAREHGYSVLLADGRRDQAREVESLEILAERRVDGLLVASSALTAHHRRWLAESPCPVVILNGESPLPSLPAVLSDNLAGGRLQAEHVLALGHRAVGYLAAPKAGYVAVSERLAGVRSAIAAARLEPDALRVTAGDGRVDGGVRAAREALASRPETTALLCYNDLTAVGALRGLRALGLRIPDDVSVVGFDDIDMAPYVDPPLTTVRQATDVIGRWAVERLVTAIETGEPAPSGVERVPVRVVVRASTALAAPATRAGSVAASGAALARPRA
jgi:LacI family transcriptional regulator, repressor for deo operon, udp, cdd, tsx, nupC, and nupG